MEVVAEAPANQTLRGITADGLEVTRSIEVLDGCLLQMDVAWRNVGASAWSGPLWVSLYDQMPDQGSLNQRRPMAMVDEEVVRWDDLSDLTEPQTYAGKSVQWFGVSDHYFGAYVLPDGTPKGTLEASTQKTRAGTVHGERFAIDGVLAPGQDLAQRFIVYIGPNELEVLRSIRPELAKAVDLGWFGFFGRILLWLLKMFHSLVGNWGVAIVCLTFLVKLIFFPLTQMSFKSSQAMQALQPKLQELREKLADNQEELNRKTIALFREHGVNPVGGCLPMLVQMPIWIALYRVLQSSVELYQTEFLYLKDLSSVDPYAIMPIVVTVLMMIQQQMTPMGNLDPAQQKIMKVMPLLISLFFFTSPSGLMVYIFVNMVLTILQQWLIKRTYSAAAA
jgi:YidC/Oxa1 family membrane protein insertase